MMQQKNRTKSQKPKENNILPLIHRNISLKQQKINHKQIPPELYEKYIRAKLQKAVQNNKLDLNYEQHIDKNNISHKKDTARDEHTREKAYASQKQIQVVRHVKSTPKLAAKSKQSKPALRHSKDRYLHNQKISMQLNLPKQINLSDESDNESVHRALTKQENHKYAQPTVFVLKKNNQFNLIRSQTQQHKAYLTENQTNGIKLEIIQNNQSLPLLQNIPKKQTTYLPPKEEKYIKQKFVGEQAINKFYNRYKNIQKVRELQEFKLQFNPITTILTILQNYNVPPKKMQVIKLKGEQAILDLRNCALGSGVSIKVVAQIIQKVKVFEQIDLSYNHITADICDIIIPNLANMKRINMSYNKIGRRGIQLFNSILSNEAAQQDCELQELNLESNHINDSSFGNFFKNLTNLNSLVILNLSKNYLGNSAAGRIKEYIMNDTLLAELYLHWCEMGPKSTKIVFEGLNKNRGVKVLDISWNQIGLDGITPFCAFLKNNDSLVHLDVSYCEIDEIDTKRIAKTLRLNHSIYGIHYHGNMGYIDFKGYLHPIKKENRETPASIRAGLIQRIHSINIVKNSHYHHYGTVQRNVCWICQGWQQKYFKINKNVSDKACFIHLDFQNFKGVLMSDKGTFYQLLRMCPPKMTQLFYSKVSNSGVLEHCHNPQQMGQVKIQAYNKKIYDFQVQTKIIDSATLKFINIITQPRYYNQIFNQDYLTKIHCQPRSDDMRAQNLFVIKPQYQQAQKPVRQKKPKKRLKKREPELIKQISVKTIPDQFENIFNRNVGQGDSHQNFIKKCVDFDISHSKVTKILKHEKDMKEVRHLLEKHYYIFQKIYYYLANNNPNVSGVYSISQQRFQKFIEQLGYETKRVTKAKIRLKLISCLSNANIDSQIQGFYRPQFFQFLLRLAIEKYCFTIPKKQGETEQQKKKRQKYPLSISDAFLRIIKSLFKYQQKAQSQKWRQQNLTSYQMNIIIKSYSYVFTQIYQKYAGITQKHMNTKIKKKMFLQQFKILCLNAQLRKTKEALKDLEVAYRTSKKLQIQDGISDTGIDYVEFLETFCRFAQNLFLVPITTENNSLWQKQIIKVQQIPLFLKIQKLLKQIYSKNYDLINKKSDLLFERGLFSEQVEMLMIYYKQKYQGKDQLRKTFLSTHAKMNSLQRSNSQKITLKFLIDLLSIKAAQIQEQNRKRIKNIQQQKIEQQESEEQKINDQI